MTTKIGEKWDQVELVDVDGDGDLAVVANCEEWWTDDDGEFLLDFDPPSATCPVYT